jgi:5'(3')-deoxyribonucleotidase
MKIWVDVDGVCANFTALYLSLLNQRFGRMRVFEEVTKFDFSACVSNKDEDRWIWQHIDATPGLVYQLDDLPGARDGLAALRTLGKVRALTSPTFGPTWMPERARWLLDRGFAKADIVFCSDKALVPGDVLIDDRLETCIEWQAAHPNGTAIVFDAPYNQGDLQGCTRCRGWIEVVECVAATARQKAAQCS